MTTLPNKRLDPEQRSSRDLADLLRSPDEVESSDSLAPRLKEQVQEEMDAFETDIDQRLSAGAVIESKLNPQDVDRVRESSGITELPRLIERAKELGGRTMKSLESTPPPPALSERLRRALGMPSLPLQEESKQAEVVHEAKVEVSVDAKERIEQVREEQIPPEVFRLERDLKLANAVEKLEKNERLDQTEVEMLAGALEGRGWQKLFSEVKPGDGLATFLVPNAEHFSIKRLNDVLFGMQKTDDIIKMRRDLLLAETSRLGLERVWTSYKDEGYVISKDRFAEEGEEVVMQKLLEAGERVSVSMTCKLAEMTAIEWEGADENRKGKLDEFIRSMIGEKGFVQYEEQRALFLASRKVWQQSIAEEVEVMQKRSMISLDDTEQSSATELELEHAIERVRASGLAMSQARYGMNTEAVIPALQADPRLGYRMTFGVTEVGQAKDGDYTHIERAVAETLAGAKDARELEEIGANFSPERAEQSVKRIAELQEKIGLQDLTDVDGRVYPVFEVRPDGGGKMVYAMNLDLIRDVRKGLFTPVSDPKQAELFSTVKEYLEAINILDVTKPYVHSEMAGEQVYGTEHTITEQVKQSAELARRLKEGSLSESDRKEFASLLKQDGKDRACSSNSEFHKKALEISNCSYISLDVLDVGPELLQEYELLLQRVANGRMTFDEARLIAGDATTKKMRAFRSEVTKAYRELCHGEDPIMSVGGDELMLAMDTAKVTDEFMLKLREIKLNEREGGSIRVVKTAIGTGERETVAEGDQIRMKEHLEAIKRAEGGTTIAKKIEKTVNQIRTAINDLPQMDRGTHLESLNQLNILNYAVHQREEADMSFELILKDPEDSSRTIRANLEGKMEELEALSSRLHKTVEDRRQAFYDEHISAHPKLTKELVPIALRRKDQGEVGFKAFIKTLE